VKAGRRQTKSWFPFPVAIFEPPTPNLGASMKSILRLNAALLVLFFAVWCVMDYFAVKSPQYPQNCHDNEWVFIFIPLVAAVANLVAQRKLPLIKSLLTAIVASVAVCVAFVAMVLFPGIMFHLSIGGTL
jgi:hypothetical protein